MPLSLFNRVLKNTLHGATFKGHLESSVGPKCSGPQMIQYLPTGAYEIFQFVCFIFFFYSHWTVDELILYTDKTIKRPMRLWQDMKLAI